MKPATFFFALTTLMIPLFTTPSVLSSRARGDDTTLVLDVQGNPLEKDSLYIISPPIWGPLGGSVMLVNPNGENQTCSEADVVQFPFSLGRPATPFTFTPVDLNEDLIKLGYPLAIQSPTVNPCEGSSTVWKVSSRIGIPDRIITTGGIFNTPDSCLTISKAIAPLFSYSYIFEYCPNSCGVGIKMCQPIGISTSYDKRHLSPKGGWPFGFVFIKAIELAASAA